VNLDIPWTSIYRASFLPPEPCVAVGSFWCLDIPCCSIYRAYFAYTYLFLLTWAIAQVIWYFCSCWSFNSAFNFNIANLQFCYISCAVKYLKLHSIAPKEFLWHVSHDSSDITNICAILDPDLPLPRKSFYRATYQVLFAEDYYYYSSI